MIHMDTARISARKEVVLVVDDNERFRATCRRWLQTRGFRNVTCVSGAGEALEAIGSLVRDGFGESD